MTDDFVWQRLVGVLRDVFEDEHLDVSRDTTARDVEAWDSISNIELIVELESAFGIRFLTGELAGLKSVGELADVIAARRSTRGD